MREAAAGGNCKTARPVVPAAWLLARAEQVQATLGFQRQAVPVRAEPRVVQVGQASPRAVPGWQGRAEPVGHAAVALAGPALALVASAAQVSEQVVLALVVRQVFWALVVRQLP